MNVYLIKISKFIINGLEKHSKTMRKMTIDLQRKRFRRQEKIYIEYLEKQKI